MRARRRFVPFCLSRKMGEARMMPVSRTRVSMMAARFRSAGRYQIS